MMMTVAAFLVIALAVGVAVVVIAAVVAAVDSIKTQTDKENQ